MWWLTTWEIKQQIWRGDKVFLRDIYLVEEITHLTVRIQTASNERQATLQYWRLLTSGNYLLSAFRKCLLCFGNLSNVFSIKKIHSCLMSKDGCKSSMLPLQELSLAEQPSPASTGWVRLVLHHLHRRFWPAGKMYDESGCTLGHSCVPQLLAPVTAHRRSCQLTNKCSL